MKSVLLKVLALIVPVVAIFTPEFFATTELSVGQISDRYFQDVLLIPSGYAFSIWGLIYLGILALAVVQVLPRFEDRKWLARARLPLIVNMVFNFAWLVTWQSLLFEVATAILVGQLATAIWLYYAMAIPRRRSEDTLEKVLRFPVRVYVGWLTVATIVGIATLLSHWEWGGWGLTNATWAAIMVAVSSLIGLALTWRWKDPVYPAVFVWAFVAIALRPDQADGPFWAALIMAALFFAAVVLAATTLSAEREEPGLFLREA